MIRITSVKRQILVNI
jgi:WASH complex subunit strumpellin